MPVLNARYALNAANARWGSLYDALYGTDAISEDDGATRSGGYNPKRGEKVIAYARAHLDAVAPLAKGSHSDAQSYQITDGQLSVSMANGTETGLADANMFIDDTGALNVLEMRAKCRRLKAERGELDLIVIDYLQLMHGRGGNEGREKEISEISRGLKALARELSCPVIALSQLNRGPLPND